MVILIIILSTDRCVLYRLTDESKSIPHRPIGLFPIDPSLRVTSTRERKRWSTFASNHLSVFWKEDTIVGGITLQVRWAKGATTICNTLSVSNFNFEQKFGSAEERAVTKRTGNIDLESLTGLRRPEILWYSETYGHMELIFFSACGALEEWPGAEEPTLFYLFNW